MLPREETQHNIITGKFETFEATVHGPAFNHIVKQGHASSRKPRNTCTVCNSGWMSRRENAARYVLMPLIRGEPIILDTLNQFLLASFLCLVSMRMERSGKDIRAIPQADIDRLRIDGDPGNHWRAWLLRYEGPENDYWCRYFGAHVALGVPPPYTGPEYCNTHVTTVVAGKLCAHISASTVLNHGGYEGIRMTRVWPRGQFPIDTRRLPHISEEGALWLHEALARESKQSPID